MSEEKMEMSKLDPRMPKYYKGYDVDEILNKLDTGANLTADEKSIFSELQTSCHPMKEIKRPFPANMKVNLYGPDVAFIKQDDK